MRAADRSSEWLPAETDLIVISARRLFPPRTLTLMLGRGELDWLDHVEVVLSAPQQPPRSVRLSAAQPSAHCFFAGVGNEPIELRVLERPQPLGDDRPIDPGGGAPLGRHHGGRGKDTSERISW